MNSDAIRLDHQLCHRFYIVSNAFTRAYRPMLKRLDLSYPQYVAMMALWEQDEITISTLLDSTRIDGGAMSLILKKLEAKDYVKIVTSSEDKRVKKVALTAKGHGAKPSAIEIAQTMRCNIKHLSAEEGQQLIALIDKLSQDLTTDICQL